MFNSKIQLSKYEIDALKLYEGETLGEGQGFFVSDKDAYGTLNLVMYPGIDRELRRIYDDNLPININAIKNTKVLVSTSIYLLSAMINYGSHIKRPISIVRVDNKDNFKEAIKKGETLSFFSTSKSILGLPKIHLNKSRQNVVLLEGTIYPGTPCIDMKDALGEDYYHSKESEILVSPFIDLKAKRINPTLADQFLKDKNHHGIISRYHIDLRTRAPLKTPFPIQIATKLYNIFDDETTKEHAGNFIEMLIANKNKGVSKEKALDSIPKEIITDYLKWKKAFQLYLRYSYNELFRENKKNKNFKER